jgi:6-phosphogluconate dehydrogenase (decarboxylating)
MAESGTQQVGMIGTGRMGGPMAERLLEAGRRLVVFDANEAALQPLSPPPPRPSPVLLST